MNAFRRNERCNKSLLWKWTIQNTLSAMNCCSEASLSVITALFVLCSPIRRMQSPIYLQNYPELWETVFPAPCCVSQCALWLKPQTWINMQTTAAPNIWCYELASLQKRQVLWCSVISCPLQDHPKHLDAPSLSLISLTHGVAPGFKLYYWHRTMNNRASGSMVGLASDSPCWSTTWLGLDVIPGREQYSFILPL